MLDAIHEIDYALALAGPAEHISGDCVSTGVLDIDVEDVADITLRHRAGVQSHIHLDYLRRGVLEELHADRERSADHVGRPPGGGGAGQ